MRKIEFSRTGRVVAWVLAVIWVGGGIGGTAAGLILGEGFVAVGLGLVAVAYGLVWGWVASKGRPAP